MRTLLPTYLIMSGLDCREVDIPRLVHALFVLEPSPVHLFHVHGVAPRHEGLLRVGRQGPQQSCRLRRNRTGDATGSATAPKGLRWQAVGKVPQPRDELGRHDAYSCRASFWRCSCLLFFVVAGVKQSQSLEEEKKSCCEGACRSKGLVRGLDLKALDATEHGICTTYNESVLGHEPGCFRSSH